MRIEDVKEYQVPEPTLYNIKDLTIRFDLDYFLNIVGEKMTEIGVFTGDISPEQSILVNELKWEPDDQHFWLEVTVQEELKH